MIEIRQNACVIQIYDDAHLSEMTTAKFRKLLKMAADKWQNDPEKIREQIIETLKHEERLRETQIHGHCVYGKQDIKYFQSCLKKIKKLRGIVEQWDI